ncbi:MAG: hypothetical protein RLZZ217_440, partial [Planctomycetota bacterium]
MTTFSPPPPIESGTRPIVIRSSIARGALGAALGIVAVAIIFLVGVG